MLALKTEFPLKFYTVLNIFFTIQDFWVTLCFPWKTEGALNSQYWLYIFYQSGFLSNLRLPWKTELPWYFYCIKHVFYITQEFWVTCAFPEKNRVAHKFFAVWNILFTFWIFEQLALSLKNRRFPEFTVRNVYFLLFRSFE